LTAASIGLIKSCQNNYNNNKPGVVHYVNGKSVIERRLDTNEEVQIYLNFEKGKWESEYYPNLNEREK